MKKYVDEEMLPTDYIIEQGVSGIWNYEKWLSGKYVCRAVVKENLDYYTITNGFYGYHSSKINYPIAFSDTPIMRYNAKVGSGFAIPGGDVQTGLSSCMCYALSTYSQASAPCVWEIEVIGRWK